MVCAEVKDITPEIVGMMDDMLDTMYAAPGIGLAAPQIGVTKRIIVADVCKEENKREPCRLINPEIEWSPKTCSPMRKAVCPSQSNIQMWPVQERRDQISG